MALLSIGDVARRAGIRASAIRYYERIGVLPAPERAGGRRRYDPAVVDALAVIRFARHLGFSLAETRALLDGRTSRPRPERWRELARRRLRDVEDLLAQAERVRALLQDALQHECPRLVERGHALAANGTDCSGARLDPQVGQAPARPGVLRPLGNEP